MRDEVEAAWPVLTALGLAQGSEPAGELDFCRDVREVVDGAQCVQESIPERVALKHALYAEIEPVLDEGTVVASWASGLTLSELAARRDALLAAVVAATHPRGAHGRA